MRQSLKDSYGQPLLKALASFSEADQDLLGAWLGPQDLGLNYAKEIVELLEDSRRLEGKPLSELLKKLEEVGAKSQLQGKKLGQLWRDYLWDRVHPESSAQEKKYKLWLRSLKLGPQVRLQAPPQFEGNDFSLQIQFKHPSELLALLQKLETQLKNGDWQTLEEF